MLCVCKKNVKHAFSVSIQKRNAIYVYYNLKKIFNLDNWLFFVSQLQRAETVLKPI